MAQKKASGRGKKAGAGEYVREEMHEEKKGRLKNPKQAIAIGLSRARRAGEDVPPPKKNASAATRKKARQDEAAGRKRAAKKTAAKKTSAKKAPAKKRSARKSQASR